MIKRHFITIIILSVFTLGCQDNSYKADQPNILWITIEDLTPMVGCYGDELAKTPNIDKLADNGVKYTNAYATAAVCSPARSCLLTGVYAPTLGTQHLRSETKVPDEIIPFPKLLRQNGYYCTNNYKEDYNFEPVNVWDESGKSAHWRNREEDQPFFAVFNFETTHQSKIFGTDKEYEDRFDKYLALVNRTNPYDVVLPSYFFDTPQTRKLWARYYDNVKIVDLQVKEIMGQLKEDGLEESTIIFFYSDHGTGMPRGKRALYNSGLKVPLIISAPDKYRDRLNLKKKSTNDRLVSFVDFAPTILNLVNIEIPSFMQGRPFLGENANIENEYVYATADRVDEAYEIVRSINNKEYRYIRNFLPHLPLIQPNFYSDQSEIMQEIYRVLESEPQLTNAQRSMWLPKRPVEELYNLSTDPYETHNLANDPEYHDILINFRKINHQTMVNTHDSGLAPEAYMYSVSMESTPYEQLQDSAAYPMEQILRMLEKLYFEEAEHMEIIDFLNHEHPLINYWTMVWLQYQNELYQEIADVLLSKLDQPESFVSITAAETLCKFGYTKNAMDILLETLNSDNEYHQLMAARAVELLGEKTLPYQSQIREILERLKNETEGKWKGYDLYASWALKSLLNKY